MMGQHIGRRVIRRIGAPPAFPGLVRPRPADWAEHIPPEDPGADIFHRLARDLVIEPGAAAVLAEGLAECPGLEEPAGQHHAAFAEWIFEALTRCRAKSVD
ncbi:hypothetical protein SA6_12160, partial [Staphylococcus epidermidis]